MIRFVTEVDNERRELIGKRLKEFNTARSPVVAALRSTIDDRDEPLDVYALDDAPTPDPGGTSTAGGDGRAAGGDGPAPGAGTSAAAGVLVGGLTGHTWAHWLHIDLLWIEESRRGGGLGSRLVARAEELARARGCTHARVETWDFQAPRFYQKLGYTIAGVVPDYPPGVTDHLLIKRLDPPTGG